MNDRDEPESPDERDWYAFRVKGHLAPCWSEWLDGLAIANLENGEALLTGPVVDQAALHGLLAKIRDLNVTLISVNRIEPGPLDSPKAGDAKLASFT